MSRIITQGNKKINTADIASAIERTLNAMLKTGEANNDFELDLQRNREKKLNLALQWVKEQLGYYMQRYKGQFVVTTPDNGTCYVGDYVGAVREVANICRTI